MDSPDLYDDAPQGGGSPAPAPDQQREHQDDQQTAVIPKSVFKGDVKPGMTYKLETVRVMDDEVECRVVADKEPEGDEGAPPMQPPIGAPEPSMMD